MPDRVALRPADVLAHAARLDTAAAAVAAAKRAGAATWPGPDAYGQPCVVVPILPASLQGLVVDRIRAAVDSLRETAARMRMGC